MLLAFSLTGCAELLSILGITAEAIMFSVDGSVVNARAGLDQNWYEGSGGATLSGATVRLVHLNPAESGKNRTATVSSTGRYSISDVTPGRYWLRGEKSGWAFVPRQVEISGFANTLPNLLAYQPPGNNTILLITEWENRQIDVDMHLVVDNANYDTLDPTVTTSPEILGTINYNTKSMFGITLERDITNDDLAANASLPAVETILIASNPFTADGTGWMRLYIKAWNVTGGLTGVTNDPSVGTVAPAKATVHTMQGTTHLGTFRIAIETYETMIGVLKIQTTYTSSATNYSIMSIGNFNNEARSIE
jgi:hypothetical protein